jgi:hypothetical protein
VRPAASCAMTQAGVFPRPVQASPFGPRYLTGTLYFVFFAGAPNPQSTAVSPYSPTIRLTSATAADTSALRADFDLRVNRLFSVLPVPDMSPC